MVVGDEAQNFMKGNQKAMRTLKKNVQKMYYALQGAKIPVYVTDKAGNIVYDEDENGERFPMKTGETRTGYSSPVSFKGNISNKLAEAKWVDYGIDNSTNYAQIVVNKGTLPIKEGSVVWKKTEVGYKDEAKTVVDETTADYVVKGVNDEGLTEDLYLLQKTVK